VDVDPRWFEHIFGTDWLEVSTRIPAERTERELGFVEEALALKRGARVLDVAGGHGRLALPLAERGYKLTILDLSADSLALARERAREQDLEVAFEERDMRELAAVQEYDAAICMFTAFGYFEDRADDVRTLRAVARALVPGGAFLLDTINPFWIARHFQQRGWSDLDQFGVLLEERGLDLERGRSYGRWTIVRADGTRVELEHSLRLYTLPEFVALLAEAGLAYERAWGDFAAAEYGLDTQRLIVLARKPS
jgi:SAM-dependent methyltransferase